MLVEKEREIEKMSVWFYSFLHVFFVLFLIQVLLGIYHIRIPISSV